MKILDGGSDSGRLNVVLVAEGYITADRALFERHAVQFAKQIQSESWYQPGSLNLHTAWIVSAERAPAAPTGEPNDTAFGAYYGGNREPHIISGNDELAKAQAAGEVAVGAPQHVVVLVNSTLYGGKGGGKGGRICWTYTDARFPARWTSTALHELGHSLFGLADEYGGPTPADRTKEPLEPNITIDPRGLKWGHLVQGAVQGAAGHDTGIYRPTRTCRMRDVTAVFCAVCSDAARRVLESYMPEPPSEPHPDEPTPARLITILAENEEQSFRDNSAGALEAVQWLLSRQFGG